eukprot:CAMPEP_0116886408 /NCGR_PEP_ID=MMETSP0463-20121206/20244_1 /TAXON_ID=181622 /ORGANISM="Strombidinopsis sp, Strain SopsisLIS2011" /LENGTH=31 /DNA_ID= /DNA_START= /DNA_END= /DNA_ORIENTATION=
MSLDNINIKDMNDAAAAQSNTSDHQIKIEVT